MYYIWVVLYHFHVHVDAIVIQVFVEVCHLCSAIKHHAESSLACEKEIVDVRMYCTSKDTCTARAKDKRGIEDN